jgi:predicted NAD/FAD-binding protein
LLQLDQPVWRTVVGGSERYVEKLTAGFRDYVRLGCAAIAIAIARTADGVVVQNIAGGRDTYDHVVIASHSDEALAMLRDADKRERTILDAIRYAPNMVYLHRDVGLMPKRAAPGRRGIFLRWPRASQLASTGGRLSAARRLMSLI